MLKAWKSERVVQQSACRLGLVGRIGRLVVLHWQHRRMVRIIGKSGNGTSISLCR